MVICYFKKIFYVVISVALLQVKAPNVLPKFPNINSLSNGYDIFQGNPLSGGTDPGWKSSIIQYSYSNGEVSSDKKYNIPDSIEASYTPVCDFDIKAYEYHREEELKNSLDQQAAFGVGLDFPIPTNVAPLIFSAGFTSSNTFISMSESMKKQHRVFTDAIATCQTYKAHHKSLRGTLQLTESFKEAVAELPLEYNKGAYLNFLEEFGTHIVGEIWYGSKVVLNSELTEEAAGILKQTGKGAAFSAHIGLQGVFGLSGGSSDSDNKLIAQRFSEMRTTFSLRVRGADPPKDGDSEAWLAKSSRMPNPILYKNMRPITELLKNQNFPDISKQNINLIRGNLMEGFKDYCASLPGCHEAKKV